MHAIGVDIGGTKIAAGVVDDEGTILAQTRRDTEPGRRREHRRGDRRRRTASSARVLRGRRDRARRRRASSPPTAPCVLFAPNIAWRDYPLRENVAAILGDDDVTIVVENDANAAGWAEFRFGAARDVDDMLMLTVGTGLGGAIVSNGELVRGAWGVAAEIGHMRVVPGGHYCGCGHEGCWEQYASGSALVRDAQAAAIIAARARGAPARARGRRRRQDHRPARHPGRAGGRPARGRAARRAGPLARRGRRVGDRPARPRADRHRRRRRATRATCCSRRRARLRRAALRPRAPAGGDDRRRVDGQRRRHGRRGRPRAALTGVPVRAADRAVRRRRRCRRRRGRGGAACATRAPRRR